MEDEVSDIAVEIQLDNVPLQGILAVPESAEMIIVFAHGSGSSRLSKRNNFVALELQKRGLATLLFDLLTEDEDRIYANRFDIDLLSRRLLNTCKWLQNKTETTGLKLAFFGASTGAASALLAAAELKNEVLAVVSRGGRPDLAFRQLARVQAPTLLIVGGEDHQVIELNRLAFQRLQCEKELQIIPGATHLFEEPGKLEEVAQLAGDWFLKYL